MSLWNDLPFSLLKIIKNLLTCKEKIFLSVCRSWNKKIIRREIKVTKEYTTDKFICMMMDIDIQRIQSLTIENGAIISNQCIRNILAILNLEYLKLRYVDPLILKQVAINNRLRYLCIGNGNTLLDFHDDLWYLENLVELDLCFCYSSMALTPIISLKNLRILRLEKCNVVDAMFMGLNNLEEIVLLNCCAVTDHTLKYMSRMYCLRYIELTGINITNNGIIWLTKLKLLKHIVFRNCNITSDVLK